MKKLASLIVVAAFLACAGNAMASKSKQEEPEGPVVIGIVIQLPDGTVKIIPMQPKNEDANTSIAPTSEIKTEVILIPPIILLPPIYSFQYGWFYYVSVPFFGWRGPNGFDYLMAVDSTGIRHDWVWLGFWYYLGSS